MSKKKSTPAKRVCLQCKLFPTGQCEHVSRGEADPWKDHEDFVEVWMDFKRKKIRESNQNRRLFGWQAILRTMKEHDIPPDFNHHYEETFKIMKDLFPCQKEKSKSLSGFKGENEDGMEKDEASEEEMKESQQAESPTGFPSEYQSTEATSEMENESGWKQQDEQQDEMRKKMREINSDPFLSPLEKTKKIQELIMKKTQSIEQKEETKSEQEEECGDDNEAIQNGKREENISSPSAVQFNGRNITFQTRILNPFLLCGLCGGYFRDAHTVKECLHTFCKSCIVIYFHTNTDCPTCGIELRNPFDTIKYDRQKQKLVDKVFPDLIAKELELEREFCKKRGISMVEPEKRENEEEKEPDVKKLKKADTSKKWYSDEVSFELIPDENEKDKTLKKLDKPFIRTSAALTVIHLKKYLKKKLELDDLQKIEITYRGAVLGNEHSLQYIFKSRGVEPQVEQGLHSPIFFYRVRKIGNELL